MDRDEALKLLGLDSSSTDDDLQQACRHLVAELSERVTRAESDAQRARYQTLIHEIERSVVAIRTSVAEDPSKPRVSVTDRHVTPATKRFRIRKIVIVASSIVLVVALTGIALRVASPGGRGAFRSPARGTAEQTLRQKAAEVARQRALASADGWEQVAEVLPPGQVPEAINNARENLAAGERHFDAQAYDQAVECYRKASEQFDAAAETAQRQMRDAPSIVAAGAKDLHDKLQRLEQELYGRVAETQRRLNDGEQLLRRTRTDDERKNLGERRRELAAELNFMKRLASVSQANVFNPSLRAELRNQLAEADAHFAAGRYPEALAAYERLKSRLEELLSWLDRIESVLRRQAGLSGEIEQLRTALGPAAQNLDVVQAALDNAASQMQSGDEELAAGRVAGAVSSYESAGARLAEVKAQAAQGLYTQAQTYDRNGQPSAAVAALNELLALNPADQAAMQLRRDILSRQITNSVGMEFVFIPPGEFLMGSPAEELDRDDDERRRSVRLASGFYMGTTEVTQPQWVAVLGHNPSNWKGDDLPVEQVTWDEAVEFCVALSRREGRTYRLPTEAEWEYACRAGATTPFSFGDIISTDQANFDGESPYGSGGKGVFRNQTTPAGSFPPNAWGLHDMHGNVWEWCLDEVTGVSSTAAAQRAAMDATAMQQPRTDTATSRKPAGRDGATVTQPASTPGSSPRPATEESTPAITPITPTPSDKIGQPTAVPPAHVLRSGSWRSHAGQCRCANRVIDTENSRLSNIGFRILLESR